MRELAKSGTRDAQVRRRAEFTRLWKLRPHDRNIGIVGSIHSIVGARSLYEYEIYMNNSHTWLGEGLSKNEQQTFFFTARMFFNPGLIEPWQRLYK